MQLFKILNSDLLQFFNISLFLIRNLLEDFILIIRLVWRVLSHAFSKSLQKELFLKKQHHSSASSKRANMKVLRN